MEFAIIHNDRSIKEIMRLIGYQGALFKKDGEFFIVRRLGKNDYPRFHLHGLQEEEAILFKLHLDESKPLFRGAVGHSGVHEGRAVGEEMKRIKSLLKSDLGVIHN